MADIPSVTSQFPYPILTSLHHGETKPNYASVKLLHRECNGNAMAIDSTHGGGNHGHLAIVLPAAQFLAISGVAFDVPVHPGPLVPPPVAATAAQIAESNRQYTAALREFTIFSAVEYSIKQLVITAIPDTFINELSDEDLGYRNVTVLQILQHLDTVYGTITADDLDENLTNLHREWNSEQPLEDLWKQIRKCMVLAQPINPISDSTAVRAVLANLERSGQFTDAIDRWRLRPAVEHTFTNLKTAFNLADKERHRKLTSLTGGFAGAAYHRTPSPIPADAPLSLLVEAPAKPNATRPQPTVGPTASGSTATTAQPHAAARPPATKMSPPSATCSAATTPSTIAAAKVSSTVHQSATESEGRHSPKTNFRLSTNIYLYNINLVINPLPMFLKKPSSPPLVPKPPPAIADTGATGHFLSLNAPYINKQKATNPINVSLANHNVMQSSHTVNLALPGLPPEACVGHLFPALGDTSLISIGQLCDAGCAATFLASTVTITHDGRTILTGTRSDATNRLWTLDLTVPQECALAARTFSASPRELVVFAHAALFSPALSTLQHALQKHYIMHFPGLTEKTLAKYPPLSVAMQKGHLDQTRRNQRSTKPPPKTAKPPELPEPTSETDATTDFLSDFRDPAPTGERTHCVYAACLESTGQIFADQTGRFIIPSSQGNTQLLVLYDYDTNYIHTEAMKTKTAAYILAAYKRGLAILIDCGCRPRLQQLDNEASKILKNHIHDEGIDFQLVPLGLHRRNAAERAIRTFKNHFIAGLCSTDTNFPSTFGTDSFRKHY
jgi:hypothetical protein